MRIFLRAGWLAVPSMLGALCFPALAWAAPTVIPMDHLVTDVAYDAARHLIYMVDGQQVLRYDTQASAFLDPFTLVGGPLSAMDLSPDGHTLAVADSDSVAVKVHLVDLDTGVDTTMTDATEWGEGGAYQVAFTRDGNLLLTTTYLGSGWVPLRKLDVSTGTFSKVLASISQDSALSSSGSGRIVGFAENNNSGGPWGYYDAWTGVAVNHFFGTSTYNWGMTTNADGSKFIINGGSIYKRDNVGEITIRDGSTRAVSVATDPVAQLGYFAFQDASIVKSYNLDSYLPGDEFDFGEAFDPASLFGPYSRAPQLRISRDGSMLLARFADGVRYVQVFSPLQADGITTSTNGRRVSIPLQGHIGNGGALSYGLQVPPAHGKVFINGNTATYVPEPGYTGEDRFVYATHYGMAVADGTVTVDVTADTAGYAPLVSFSTLPVLQATTPIAGSSRVPGDFNGDGTSDLPWFNPGTSQLGYWTMAPASDASDNSSATVRRLGARTYNVSAGYLVGAVGDFNGDGYADLMFTSPARDLWLWTNSKTGGWRSRRSYDYPSAWQLVGAGDVDGDGKDDLLWLDPSDCKFAYWLMDGAVRRGSSVMNVACGYYPAGVGYYSPSKRISILWTSAANDLYVWDARGRGFVSYDLTGALQANGIGFDMSQVWAIGGGYAGKGIGVEWNAQEQRFAMGLKLDRTFDTKGNQTACHTSVSWSGGLWSDNPYAAGFLAHRGSAPASALYAVDPQASSIQTGGLPGVDGATSGSAPRFLRTEWTFPAGWQTIGAPGNPGVPLPWH